VSKLEEQLSKLTSQVKQLEFEKETAQEARNIISSSNSERFLKLQREFEDKRA
jgi:hypothetical protein